MNRAPTSEERSRLREKRQFLRGGFAPENVIAVREPAEAVDNVTMAHREIEVFFESAPLFHWHARR